MKLEPATVFMSELSRKARRIWTSGAKAEPYAAVAIRHCGTGTLVMLELARLLVFAKVALFAVAVELVEMTMVVKV